MSNTTAPQEAGRLLRDYWDGSLPVRLTEMSVALGAHKYEADLGPLLSGVVSKDIGVGPRVALNSALSAARRRFIWAHQLGHIIESGLAGRGEAYAFLEVIELTPEHPQAFADDFARALLMPEAEVRRLEADGQTPGQMARAFAVTVGAVAARLDDLERISDGGVRV